MESSRTGFDEWLKARFPSERIRFQEPMSLHTTFRVGGPARYMAMPADEEEIRLLIRQCRRVDLPWFVVGNGSNLLVGDRGYRGVIVALGRHFSEVEKIEDNKIRAGAGALLSVVAKAALREALTGMEFASGIPGTMGGAGGRRPGTDEGPRRPGLCPRPYPDH